MKRGNDRAEEYEFSEFLYPDEVEAEVCAFDNKVADKLSNVQRLNIAMIDDNPSDVQLFKDLLDMEPDFEYSFNAWYKSDEGLRYLMQVGKDAGTTPPDLIVVDITMPNMNGLEVLEKLRQNPCLKETPIIVYSSNTNIFIIKELKKLEATAFFHKPLNISEFMEFIGR